VRLRRVKLKLISEIKADCEDDRRLGFAVRIVCRKCWPPCRGFSLCPQLQLGAVFNPHCLNLMGMAASRVSPFFFLTDCTVNYSMTSVDCPMRTQLIKPPDPPHPTLPPVPCSPSRLQLICRGKPTGGYGSVLCERPKSYSLSQGQDKNVMQ